MGSSCGQSQDAMDTATPCVLSPRPPAAGSDAFLALSTVHVAQGRLPSSSCSARACCSGQGAWLPAPVPGFRHLQTLICTRSIPSLPLWKEQGLPQHQAGPLHLQGREGSRWEPASSKLCWWKRQLCPALGRCCPQPQGPQGWHTAAHRIPPAPEAESRELPASRQTQGDKELARLSTTARETAFTASS